MKTTYRSIVLKVMEPMTEGYLRMTLPTGQHLTFGRKGSAAEADIQILNDDFFRKCVLHGDIGFGESYVDGDWETSNIVKVVEWMILNAETHPTLMGSRQKRTRLNLLKILSRFQHHLNQNTVAGSRKNIREHYDLGNAFFETFLDPGMTYSCAYFKNDYQSLGEAQSSKYEVMCRKLLIRREDHVLEIGGGWGGFAEFAAVNLGCRVTTATISKEQYEFMQKRFKEKGLSHQIHVELSDYRHLKGRYDKIVSIEMIEAVGHDFLGEFFAQCHHLLKPNGLLGLQMILSPDHRYESFRKSVDWIQKHIFPGGILPSFGQIMRSVGRTGDLGLHAYEDMTPFYARTLSIWREAFNQNSDAVKALGFDEKFMRKWNYYLSYCEAAFSMRNISVAQAVFTRPNNRELSAPLNKI